MARMWSGREYSRGRGRRRGSLLPLFSVSLAALAVSVVALWLVVSEAAAGKSAPLPVQALPADIPQLIAEATAEATAALEPVLPAKRPPAPYVDVSALEASILAAMERSGGSASVVVLDPNGNRLASIDSGREFYAASLFKLAVLYEAERRISLGEMSLDQPILYTYEAVAEDLGTLGGLPIAEDGTLPLGDVLHAMVTRSDNASAVVLLHLMGAAAIDDTLAALGLEATSVNTYDLPTTAGDMARLMQAIVSGEGVSPYARDHMRDLLLAQGTRDGIPRGLPEGIPVGNKTGTWEGAGHDVGFFAAPAGDYVIAVLTDRGWDWGTIAGVTAAVYEAVAE